MPLTSRQKAKIVKTSPNIGSYMLMQQFAEEFNHKVALLEKHFANKLEAMRQEALQTFATVKAMQKGDTGAAGRDGRDGYTPTREELIEMIRPLIPKVKDGRTPTREELVALMPQVPDINTIAELVVNRISLPDTPTAEAVADMVIEKLKEKKIGVSEVEGLQNILNALNRNIAELKSRKKLGGGGGGGAGNWQTDDFTGDGSTATFTLSSKVASNGTAIIVLLNGQVQEQGTHYSVSGTTLTFTTAPFNGAAIHAWYSRT